MLAEIIGALSGQLVRMNTNHYGEIMSTLAKVCFMSVSALFGDCLRLIDRAVARQLGPRGHSQNWTPLRKFLVATPFSFKENKGNALFRYNC